MTTAWESLEQQRRALTSEVKRLRAASLSDPALTDSLADALTALVGNRLLAWAHAQAAADAPESVLLAARILAGSGVAGPYTSLPAAVRFFTASAQLAAVQTELGQIEAAARTLDGLDAWRAQADRLPLTENLPATAVIWERLARARTLVSTDPGRANTLADSCAEHWLVAGLADDGPSAYLGLALRLTLAECRWAAGQPESALAQHRLALIDYRRQIGGLDRTSARPATIQIAYAPAADIYLPYARRLELTGDRASATVLRRELEASFLQAEATAAEPATMAPLGTPIRWSPIANPAVAARLQAEEQAAVVAGATARLEAERDERLRLAQAEQSAAAQAAERAEAERRATAQAAATAAAAAESVRQDAEQAAARRAAEEVAARAEAERRRAELAAEHRPATDPAQLAAAEATLHSAREQRDRAADDLISQAVAHEQLADVLRPLAAADPASYAGELRQILETLVGLRWRLGDPEGSREAAREARRGMVG